MTEIDLLPPHLQQLGEQLVAVADELNSGRRKRPRRASRRIVACLAVAALALPAAAIAAAQLITPDQVAQSLPAGEVLLEGTHPRCTVLVAGSQYHCVLAKAPAAQPDGWAGANEITEDSNGDVSGACIAQDYRGTLWTCYVGQAAVDHGLVFSKQQWYQRYGSNCAKVSSTNPAPGTTAYAEKVDCGAIHPVYLGSHVGGPGVG
jgi:hypothetical protein